MAYQSKRQMRGEARKTSREFRAIQRAAATKIPDYATTRTTKRIFRHLFPERPIGIRELGKEKDESVAEPFLLNARAESHQQEALIVGSDVRLAAQVTVGAAAALYEFSVMASDVLHKTGSKAVSKMAEIILEDVPG